MCQDETDLSLPASSTAASLVSPVSHNHITVSGDCQRTSCSASAASEKPIAAELVLPRSAVSQGTESSYTSEIAVTRPIDSVRNTICQLIAALDRRLKSEPLGASFSCGPPQEGEHIAAAERISQCCCDALGFYGSKVHTNAQMNSLRTIVDVSAISHARQIKISNSSVPVSEVADVLSAASASKSVAAAGSIAVFETSGQPVTALGLSTSPPMSTDTEWLNQSLDSTDAVTAKPKLTVSAASPLPDADEVDAFDLFIYLFFIFLLLLFFFICISNRF